MTVSSAAVAAQLAVETDGAILGLDEDGQLTLTHPTGDLSITDVIDWMPDPCLLVAGGWPSDTRAGKAPREDRVSRACARRRVDPDGRRARP
jgi:hypothetical protein